MWKNIYGKHLRMKQWDVCAVNADDRPGVIWHLLERNIYKLGSRLTCSPNNRWVDYFITIHDYYKAVWRWYGPKDATGKPIVPFARHMHPFHSMPIPLP